MDLTDEQRQLLPDIERKPSLTAWDKGTVRALQFEAQRGQQRPNDDVMQRIDRQLQRKAQG